MKIALRRFLGLIVFCSLLLLVFPMSPTSAQKPLPPGTAGSLRYKKPKISDTLSEIDPLGVTARTPQTQDQRRLSTNDALESETWLSALGGASSAYAVVLSDDGGYVAAGLTSSYGFGDTDVWVFKLDGSGNIVWQKVYGGAGEDDAWSLAKSTDGYLIAGMTSMGNGGPWVLKLNGVGDVVWQKTFGSSSDGWANTIIPASNGGYVIAGQTPYSGSGSQAWVMKISEDGNVLWTKSYPGLGGDGAASIAPAGDGGYLLWGNSNGFASIVKLFPSGDVQWSKTYGSSGWINSVSPTSDGGYIVGSFYLPAGASSDNAWILKLDSSGSVSWQKDYGEVGYSANAVVPSTDGGYLVAGKSLSYGHGTFLLKLDSAGNKIWLTQYSGFSIWYSMKPTTDGYVLAGDGAKILKVDLNGSTDASCFISPNISATGKTTTLNTQTRSLTTSSMALSSATSFGNWSNSTASSNPSCVSPRYSISGHVIDNSNNPVSGVNITNNLGVLVTTDGSGGYTLRSLKGGTYSITPSKSGYIFAPTSRANITVPPSVTDKNFIMRTVPAPFLDIPVNYSNFARALQGNQGTNPGLVNSWLDHFSPNYSKDSLLWRWDGCKKNDTDDRAGDTWYDGHSGIDFQKKLQDDPVYAAASGTVKDVNRNWPASVGARGSLYGNYVLIDHGKGYATLYGHLRSIEPWVNVGTNVTSPRAQRIGIIGGTGGFEEHLHFGLYYDANGNGTWEETAGGYSEAVDPYSYRYVQGCNGPTNDPNLWNITSRYLWKQQIVADNPVGNSGAQLTTPSGNKKANIPSGALPSILTVQFGDAPPVAGASAQSRTMGQSFLLQVLEWLTGESSSSAPTRRTALSSFNQPVTIQVNYSDSDTKHLDASNVEIYRWDSTGSAWVALHTTVDASQKIVTAQTTETGSFDLQAPLKCPADTAEIDDVYYAAKGIISDGTSMGRIFDIPTDEDWFKFDATAGQQYVIQTLNLASGVDTVVEVYQPDGVTLLAADDNGGGGKSSHIIWQAPEAARFFVRVRQTAGSTSGCNATYQVRVNPFIASPTPTDTSSPTRTATFTPSATPTLTCAAKPATPVLAKPKNNGRVNKLNVKLNWNDDTCTNTYTVIVHEGSKKGPKVQTQKNLTASQFKTKTLTSGKIYFWRIVAINGNGKAKSPWWSFKIQ